MSTDSYLLPSLDKALSEGGRVNWKCLNKLINFINTNDGFTPELHYSLKSRLKLKDTQKVLNTLTVGSFPIFQHQVVPGVLYYFHQREGVRERGHGNQDETRQDIFEE